MDISLRLQLHRRTEAAVEVRADSGMVEPSRPNVAFPAAL